MNWTNFFKSIKRTSLILLLWLFVFDLTLAQDNQSKIKQGLPSANVDQIRTDSLAPQLSYYLQQAARNNPELKVTFNHYLASLEMAPQAGTLPDPQLAFGYFINPIETRVGPQEARFSVSQMFPWIGTLKARKQVKVKEAQAKHHIFQNKRNHLFYRVKSTWYDLYVLNEHLAIIDENIDILESLEALALQKYETAQSSQADVLQVQIELEDLRIRKQNLLDDRQVLHQQFSELLNRDTLEVPPNIDVSSKQLPAPKEILRQQVLQNNPMLNQLSFEQQAAKESIRAAKLDGLPKVGIGVDYIFTGERETILPGNGQDAFMARASIKLPLYRKKYNAQKRQAEIQHNAVKNQQATIQNKLITELEQELRTFKQSQRKIYRYKQKQISRTQQAINVLMEKYSSADTDFEEILRLQRRLLEYQQNRETAIGNQNKALAYIEYLTGHYNIEPQLIRR
jgi:outer membrane protein TolC